MSREVERVVKTTIMLARGLSEEAKITAVKKEFYPDRRLDPALKKCLKTLKKAEKQT